MEVRSALVKLVRTSLFFCLVSLALPLPAQDAAAYISRLTAQAGPTSVLLTWKDAEGWPGVKYEVWRSDKEIIKDSLPQAKLLATVNAGVEAYEDTTVAGPSFYLVLLKDTEGTRRGYYIPYRNKTLTAVKPDGAAAKSTARIKVGDLAYANPQVLISFTAYPTDRKLVVFRRATAISALADLKDATLLGNTTGAQSPYKDTPPPGLEFYYAILDAQAFADGKTDAFQTENTTATPAGFPLVARPADAPTGDLDSGLRPGLDSTRALPLPLLQFDAAPGSGAPLVGTAYEPIQPQDLPPASEAALKVWAKASKSGPLPLPAPLVLPEERTAAQTGAGRYLVQIQTAYFVPKDWKGAAVALESVLKLSLEPRTQARARFYLGEARAYLKDYRRAFLEVLSARDEYPGEAGPLLEALFTLLDEGTN
jgi:hypothetical protein